MRVLGALALLAVGAVHLQQYAGGGYDAIPTIGPLFLLNAIAAGLIGAALLLPLERWLFSGRPAITVGLLAAGGVAIAVGSLVALFISESSSLFGFSESGYDSPIVAAIVAEALTILLLMPVTVAALRRVVSGGSGATPSPRSREGVRVGRGASAALQRR